MNETMSLLLPWIMVCGCGLLIFLGTNKHIQKDKQAIRDEIISLGGLGVEIQTRIGSNPRSYSVAYRNIYGNLYITRCSITYPFRKHQLNWTQPPGDFLTQTAIHSNLIHLNPTWKTPPTVNKNITLKASLTKEEITSLLTSTHNDDRETALLWLAETNKIGDQILFLLQDIAKSDPSIKLREKAKMIRQKFR